MAESETGQERTEEATPKRRREAREKGQVARSRELNTMTVLMVAALTALLIGGTLAGKFVALLESSFEFSRENLESPWAMVDTVGTLIWNAITIFTPFALIMLVAAVLGPMSMGGLNFSTKALAFKGGKLNPLKGLKRIFSAQGLMELIKTLAKFIVVAGTAAVLLNSLSGSLMALGRESLLPGIAHAMEILSWSCLALAAILLIIAAVDTPFQIWQHSKQLRMTRQEVRDELKDTEGRPEVKGRIRQLQQQMAQQRMMEDVPGADVVVTNPSHYSVALRYGADDEAPIVVAKGADLIALRIRELAKRHEVMIFEAPPLARALYSATEVNQRIPIDLYHAVAQVLAYVFQLRTVARHDRSRLRRPVDLEIPDSYQDVGDST